MQSLVCVTPVGCRHDDMAESKGAIVVSQRKRRSRYPPITPNACAKDDVTNSVFDGVWHMLTDEMRILLQRYSEHFVITHPMVIEGAEEVDHGDGHLKLPQILLSGSQLEHMSVPIAHGSHRHVSGSVLTRQLHAQVHNSNDQLRKILNIRKIEMNARERTFLL